MTHKKSHVIGEVDHTAGEVAAKLRGVAHSFKASPARPSDPGFEEWVPYFLKLYGLALRLAVETPTVFRRWTETLSAEALRRALGDAARHDTEFRESISYHEGVRETEWFVLVDIAIFRVTLPAFIANPKSALGVALPPKARLITKSDR